MKCISEKKRFKLSKQTLIPLAVLVFVILGLEFMAYPYVPFGAGRWYDSASFNVSNRKSAINGALDVRGTITQNGSPISGADVSFDTLYSVGKDSTKLLTLKNRSTTYIGSNTFNNLTTFDQIYITGAFISESGVTADALTVVNGATIGADLEISGDLEVTQNTTLTGNVDMQGLTRNGSGDDWTYNYLWRGLLPTGGNPYFNIAHGLTRRQYQNIKSWSVTIHHDTTTADKGIYTNGSHYGSHAFYVRIDSTNIKWENVLAFKGDSAFVLFTLTNYPERTPWP